MYQLIDEKEINKRITRTYRNQHTGSEVKTSLIYTDQDGGKWFGFNDLYKIPYIRTAYARHIQTLYNAGLSLKDVLKWCEEEKALLRSEDSEKYEKLYSLILEKERLANFTADPIRQQLALCTVYVLEENERIDYFDDSQAEQKLNYWKNSTSMTAFFLTWLTDHMRHYIKILNKTSQTVSKMEKLEKMKADYLKP